MLTAIIFQNTCIQSIQIKITLKNFYCVFQAFPTFLTMQGIVDRNYKGRKERMQKQGFSCKCVCGVGGGGG